MLRTQDSELVAEWRSFASACGTVYTMSGQLRFFSYAFCFLLDFLNDFSVPSIQGFKLYETKKMR